MVRVHAGEQLSRGLEFTCGDRKNFGGMRNRDEMSAFGDFMPDRARHLLANRSVHRLGDQGVRGALPQVDRPTDVGDVEGPLLVQRPRRSPGHWPLAGSTPARTPRSPSAPVRRRVPRGRPDSPPSTGSACTAAAKVRRRHVDQVVHESEARPKVQREETAKCVGLGQLLGRPVRSEGAVRATCHAGDVHQPRWVEIGRRRERPWAPSDQPVTANVSAPSASATASRSATQPAKVLSGCGSDLPRPGRSTHTKRKPSAFAADSNTRASRRLDGSPTWR